MTLALRSAGPAIFASGVTVIVALLTLSVAELNSTASLGPIGALGIAVAMTAMLTLLPARWCSRRAACSGHAYPMWERRGTTRPTAAGGTWRNASASAHGGSGRAWPLLLLMALGNLNYNDSLTTGNSFRDDVDSVEGQELIDQSFPGGANAPTEVVVEDPARASGWPRALRRTEGVADVRVAARGEDGVLLNVILDGDPYDSKSFDVVPRIREVAAQRGRAGNPGGRGDGGGVRRSAGEQARRQGDRAAHAARGADGAHPAARALVAPLILTATVVLSFAAALGVGFIVFDVIFGFPGSTPDLALFAFVFLVALGIDYNIFLMARVREESARYGAREGMTAAWP